ncbi:MAG: DNA-binding transcriptional regulator, AcrR family [Chloroflexi bacterium AL-W]|nr:DNA-binding transcriptional regulator, AcrR family [Chloroflexi bacterium AL-N1]NOK68311.1 DNA-binding transcriptional regulator, AcrR family [Chloroflexi bacterium AL-N10]NOK73957.1 DNA-binding transcriptional regulator, AcrR family [Chloroflexi bacterium AL-N5]NOK82925.1 DNA-binding transcriptional regulator, AcrR family [Chloroflexi bacterium AL-W]NOK90447.1 DNA-binding transcriptional regulator, AcrR family [Chloroflexi bacterium AL-N15]
MSSTESETRTRILAKTVQLMEEQPGQTVRMQDIATAVGVSRQAVYLHFGSRTELLVAATRYVDEVRDLDGRLRKWNAAVTGIERLDEYIAFWGHYIPEVYGVAMALLAVRETDKAAAAAWRDRMDAVRDGCHITIEALQRDGMLDPIWTCDKAIDLFWTMLAIRNWEQITIECNWSTDQYVSWMQTVARRTFVREAYLEVKPQVM